MRKVYVETMGCQMNKSDTERIVGMLSHFGYEETTEEQHADLLIINTCSIRQLSADKAYSKVGIWGKWKSKRRDLKIAFCGCVAQQDKEGLLKRFPYVDLVFGTNNVYELPHLIERINNDERVCATSEKPFEADPCEYDIKRAKSFNAWIPIMEGCNNFCTYCIVPFTRGRERSRTPESIITEAKRAVDEGFKEITLLGQNVDSYGKNLENATLANLLRELNKIEGKFRIRFVTSYPTDISDDLIEAVKECDKVCEYFHIPMQSGNSDVLKAMNRRYNREEYGAIVKKIRDTFENVTITSDFIAGFPGETEEQFLDTLSAIEEFELDYSNTAAYSPREKTKAAKWTEKFLSEEVKFERLERLNEKNREACLKSNKKFIGKTLEVLVESYEKGVLTGRTRNNKIVHFEGGESLVGEFLDVNITDVKTWYLKGLYKNG
jgi:tRNA-2-methylthio-N6-dimethylallyladenosine synthase